MAYVTMTYTFTNSTTADASQVNTNFQDLVDATSDASIDFNVAGVTCTSLSCTGNTAIGNTSGDDVTVSARLASDFIPKTTNLYSLGSSSLGFTGIYFGANSQTVRIMPSASMSATWTMTLPVSAGNAGEVPVNSGSGTLIWAIDPNAAYNYSLAATANSPSSNILTIALKNNAGSDPSSTSPVSITFRSATATTGTSAAVLATAATSLAISSGSTLGHVSAANEYIYVYAINNAGTIEMAASSSYYDDGSILSTTVEGGAGGADSATLIYSTTARSNVPSRFIGRLKSNQATAGAWATSISEITSFASFRPMTARIKLSNSAGTASTNTRILYYNNLAENFGGQDITLTQSATNGDSFTINTPGMYSVHLSLGATAATRDFYLLLNTTTTVGLTATTNLGNVTRTSGTLQAISGTYYFKPGDIIRSGSSATSFTEGNGINELFYICKVG